MLKACKYVLSAFFSGFSDKNTRWINPDINDFSIQINDGVNVPSYLCKYICVIPDNMNHCPIVGECYNPGEGQEYYTLQKNSKKNSRALITGITRYRDYANLLQETYTRIDDNQITIFLRYLYLLVFQRRIFMLRVK